jgi:hypothetical protein
MGPEAVIKRAVSTRDSYGGVVVTEAGTDPKVKGFVYITAFAPDKGESVESLNSSVPWFQHTVQRENLQIRGPSTPSDERADRQHKCPPVPRVRISQAV